MTAYKFYKRLFKNRMYLFGLILLLIGSGPLLAILLAAKLGILADPDPNPVFLGMLAYFTFWPSIITMGIGVYKTIKSSRNDENE